MAAGCALRDEARVTIASDQPPRRSNRAGTPSSPACRGRPANGVFCRAGAWCSYLGSGTTGQRNSASLASITPPAAHTLRLNAKYDAQIAQQEQQAEEERLEALGQVSGSGDEQSSTTWGNYLQGLAWGFTIGSLVDDTIKVHNNTEHLGILERAYVVGGFFLADNIGIRGILDAFSQHDAAAGQVQSTFERTADGILGTIQLAATVLPPLAAGLRAVSGGAQASIRIGRGAALAAEAVDIASDSTRALRNAPKGVTGGKYNLTETVANHLDDVIKRGPFAGVRARQEKVSGTVLPFSTWSLPRLSAWHGRAVNGLSCWLLRACLARRELTSRICTSG